MIEKFRVIEPRHPGIEEAEARDRLIFFHDGDDLIEERKRLPRRIAFAFRIAFAQQPRRREKLPAALLGLGRARLDGPRENDRPFLFHRRA
jgi:hypothetical protein